MGVKTLVKVCPICNEENNDVAEFCQVCGQDLAGVEPVVEKKKREWRFSGPIVPSIVILIFSALVVWFVYLSPMLADSSFTQTAVNGTASIVDVQNTNSYYNGNPQVDFTLLVTIPGKYLYTANSSAVIPYVYLNNFQPGDNCSVLVDPKNPKHVKITNT